MMESIHAQVPQTLNVKNKFMISNNVPLSSKNIQLNSNLKSMNGKNDVSEISSRKELLMKMKSRFDRGEKIDIPLNNSEES
jgi:hypothetical protein